MNTVSKIKVVKFVMREDNVRAETGNTETRDA